METENCCTGCNRPDLPWAGRGTELPIAGCRFTLYPMSDKYIEIILGSLEKTNTSAVWSETDALSTVYRGKLPYVADAVQALFLNAYRPGVHMALEGQFSKGCPGDVSGDSVLNREGEAPNAALVKDIHFPVHCKLALYPLGDAQYIDEIAKRVIDEAQADGVDILSLPRVDGGVDKDGEPLGEGDSEQREEFRKRAVPMMFDEIQKSMKDFRVNFDVWFHENSLYADGKVDAAIEELKSRGDIFDKDGATWFESTKHGDDKDRVIIKSNGEFAYFAADIAYYWDKRHRAENSADVAIYMLGADHHGYIGRMMAMCAAFGDEPGKNMQILIGQLVNVMKDGKPVRMSKRAGNVVTIDDLVSVVGVDAARYSLARSDYNQNFDIDLALLASHTNDNPVYYVQYAHARSCNVDRNAAAAGITYEGADVSLLDTTADGEVLAALAQWPALLREAGDLRAPHRVAHYLEDLAATYHKWYNVERVVPMELTDPEARGEQADAIRIAKAPEPARAAARLKLNDAVKTVIAEGLDLLGVTAPDKM